MPLETWGKVFASIREAARLTDGDQVQTIVWHGGEPTLLDAAYVGEVLALQTSMIGNLIERSLVYNAVQTNLYSWNDCVDLFVEKGFQFSVSCDFAPGARKARGGQDAEARVSSNLRRLLGLGVEPGVLLVLARHNRDELPRAHDEFVRLGVRWLKIVTAYDPGNAAPVGDLLLQPDEAADSLLKLAAHRGPGPHRMAVSPLDRVTSALVRRIKGIDLSSHARTRTRVDMDGSWDRSPSPSQVASICGRCRFSNVCDKNALNDAPRAIDAQGPCNIDFPLLDRFEAVQSKVHPKLRSSP